MSRSNAAMPRSAGEKQAKKFVRKTKAERRSEIIAATVHLIGRYGVHGTTVSRIAQEAGIARGALYQHFPNREAVLEAALDAWREQSSAWMSSPGEGDVPARLLRMGEAHSSWALSADNTFVRPFFQLIASNRETALTRSIIRRQHEDLERLVALVEEGKKQGSISTEVESVDVAWTLLLHAWGEDIARLMGVEEFVTAGVSGRILARSLSSFAGHSARAKDQTDPIQTGG
jgi:AcrR family transcriptional regulator